MNPFWLIFFRWVGSTTNQSLFYVCSGLFNLYTKVSEHKGHPYFSLVDLTRNWKQTPVAFRALPTWLCSRFTSPTPLLLIISHQILSAPGKNKNGGKTWKIHWTRYFPYYKNKCSHLTFSLVCRVFRWFLFSISLMVPFFGCCFDRNIAKSSYVELHI